MIICSTTNLFLLYFSCIRADTSYIMWGKFVLELLHGLVLSATGDLQLCLVTNVAFVHHIVSASHYAAKIR